MCAKSHIQLEIHLHLSAHNLLCHILADVDRRRQFSRIRAQRYGRLMETRDRETHGDQR